MPRHENIRLKLSVDNTEPRVATRPNSSPIALEGVDLSSIEGSFSPSLLPPLPFSPPPLEPNTQFNDPSKNNPNGALVQAPQSAEDESQQSSETAVDRGQFMRDDEVLRPSSSSMSKIYHLRKAPGSTPELSLVGSADSVTKAPLEVPLPTNSKLRQALDQQAQSGEGEVTKRKEKSFRNPLTRSKSMRKDSNASRQQPNGVVVTEPTADPTPVAAHALPSERSTMDMLKPRGKEKRGKSAERTPRSGSEDNFANAGQNLVTRDAPASRDKERSNFLTGSKNALSKAKTGGGNFLTRIGKIGRSGSSHEKESAPHVEEQYTLKVINLPLVEQTRITRISKSLDACKDKTEYWMPSLPWRCIDYLNLNCESEGLYRIPGSGPQIKQWQKRFDTEYDIDLLDEEDLYDPNNISSLLKQWLRELPTEIIPADVQASLAVELEKENPEYTKMGQPAPKKLRDALSELPPFNYYLLFAITCHLSLLVSHQDKNRMDLNNLSICIGPCLKMERWLFNYLVGDWRHCWQGCWTEKQTLEAEKKFENPDYVPSDDEEAVQSAAASINPPQPLHPPPQSPENEDRAMSSGGESMVSAREDLHDFREVKDRPATAATSTSSRPQTSRSRDNSNIRSPSSTRKAQSPTMVE